MKIAEVFLTSEQCNQFAIKCDRQISLETVILTLYFFSFFVSFFFSELIHKITYPLLPVPTSASLYRTLNNYFHDKPDITDLKG